MATITAGYTFGATEQVTATKLGKLASSGGGDTTGNMTVTNIVAADITDGVITDAKIASVSGAKFTTLSTTPSGAGILPIANGSTGLSAIGTANRALVTTDGTAWTVGQVNLTNMVTGILPVANLGTGTPSASNYLRGDGAWSIPPNSSNVIFCWIGSDSAATNSFGMVEGTSLTPGMNSYTVNYHFFGVYNTTYRTIMTGRFVKIAGISTVTIHAKLWSDTLLAIDEAVLSADIGGQANTVKSVESTTPTWVTTSTIDVSSLTNGTAYDITIQLKSESGQSAYCSGLILTGS